MRIRCAICDKPVDRIERWYNEASERMTVKVFCHGDTDRMEMSAHFLEGLSLAERLQLEASEGVAFTTKRVAKVSNPAV